MAQGCSQSGLCVGQSPGPVCLASLMSTAAPLNMVLTFSHINVAEKLSLMVAACMHYSCTLIHIHKNTRTLFPTSHSCSESTRTGTKTHQKVSHCNVYPHISHSHTQTHLQTTHCTQRSTPQISPGLSQHTLNSTIVDMLQVLRSSAPDVPPKVTKAVQFLRLFSLLMYCVTIPQYANVLKQQFYKL